MDSGRYLLALAAGLLAALNPCGFALLPAYLGLLARDSGSPGSALARALGAAAAMTTGFVLVFGTFGLLVVRLALSIERYLPWVTLVVGLLLVALGVALVAGREFGLRLPHPRWAPRRHGSGWSAAGSWTAYGVAYALASLSCAAGPFLALTTSTFRSAGAAEGVAVFVTFALGMGAIVGALSVAVTVTGDGMLRRMRSAPRAVPLISGILVLVTGAYVAWYGWYEVRVLRGDITSDPVVDRFVHGQETVVGWIAGVGAEHLAWVLLIALALGTVWVVAARAGASAGRSQASPDVPEQPSTRTSAPGP